MKQLGKRCKGLAAWMLAIALALMGAPAASFADDTGTGGEEYLLVLQNNGPTQTTWAGIPLTVPPDGNNQSDFIGDSKVIGVYKSENGAITKAIEDQAITGSNWGDLDTALSSVTSMENITDVKSENGATVYFLARTGSGISMEYKNAEGDTLSPTGDYSQYVNDHVFYKLNEVTAITDAALVVNMGGRYFGNYSVCSDGSTWPDWQDYTRENEVRIDTSTNSTSKRVIATLYGGTGHSLTLTQLEREITMPATYNLIVGGTGTLTATITVPAGVENPSDPSLYNWYRCNSNGTYSTSTSSWYDHGIFQSYESSCPITIDDYGNITAKDGFDAGTTCDVVAVLKGRPDVTARCTVKLSDTYQVTFYNDMEGTQATGSPQEVKPGTALSALALPSDPSHDGYYFAGWTTTKAADADTGYDYRQAMSDDGKSDEAKASYPCVLTDFTTGTVNADTAFYPVFVKDRLNVILEPNGGTLGTGFDGNVQSANFTVNIDEPIAMTGLLNTTRTGYGLAGWYTAKGVNWNPEGTSDSSTWWPMTPEYADSSTPVKHDSRPYNYYTVTLTAHWTPNSVDVAYELDGGTASDTTGDTTATLEGTLTLPGTPTKDGHAFTGWLDAGGTLHSAGEVMAFEDWSLVGDDGKLTLTAKYIETPNFGVWFDTQGGTAVDPQVSDGGSSITVTKPADPTRTGYTFAGWYDAAEGGNEVSFPLEAEADITLYAHWTIDSYTITFDMNEATSAQIAPLTLAYGAAVDAPADPEREHYTFAGWSPELPQTMPAHNLAVEATWEALAYTITFKTGASDTGTATSGSYGSLVTLPDDPSAEHLTFAGWKYAGEPTEAYAPLYMPDTNPTIIAQWMPAPGTVDAAGTGEDGKITGVNDAMRYRPVGAPEWTPVPSGATEVSVPAGTYEVMYALSGDEPEDYKSNRAATVTVGTQTATITLLDSDGTPLGTIEDAVGAPLTAPADPTREGYTFDGWDPEFPSTMPAESVTLRAKWTQNTTEKAAASSSKRGFLLAKMTAKGSTSLKITWTKVVGAKGYDIFFTRCNHDGKISKYKKVKSVKAGTTSWTKKKLLKRTPYKAYVKAYKVVNGKKRYFATSPSVHSIATGASRTYTNPGKVILKKASVALKVGSTYKVRASVKKLKSGKKLLSVDHTPWLRYVSNDKSVAKVTKKGKIVAVAKGTCKVYVLSSNGVRNAVKVTVK